ncbi:MAG TPA: hypothetical protein VN026_12585 [Bacteroidia bacterium]|jgi:hypothetical protein|nr:hypothetical protein [Bacteroidia bacterium]
MVRLLIASVLFMFSGFIKSQVNYIYSDGNSNSYNISETHLNYEPVTKENSSSGNHSGGEAKSKTISQKDFEKINALFKEAISAKTEQQSDRVMQSGLLIHKKGKKTIEQIVLKPSSDYIRKIETLLKSFL